MSASLEKWNKSKQFLEVSQHPQLNLTPQVTYTVAYSFKAYNCYDFM